MIMTARQIEGQKWGAGTTVLKEENGGTCRTSALNAVNELRKSVHFCDKEEFHEIEKTYEEFKVEIESKIEKALIRGYKEHLKNWINLYIEDPDEVCKLFETYQPEARENSSVKAEVLIGKGIFERMDSKDVSKMYLEIENRAKEDSRLELNIRLAKMYKEDKEKFVSFFTERSVLHDVKKSKKIQ